MERIVYREVPVDKVIIREVPFNPETPCPGMWSTKSSFRRSTLDPNRCFFKPALRKFTHTSGGTPPEMCSGSEAGS